jgi:putative peptidoglycan lipid II flippase
MGVAAFVGIPAVALWRTGFHLRPRLDRNQGGAAVPGDFSRAVRLSGWAGLQHAGTGILLGAALLVGMGVTGGVVAYQVAFACFLVPYAVLSLPLITAVLPELAGEAGSPSAFGRRLRWALERMTVLVIPVSVAGVVLAPPVMEVLAFGQTSAEGGRLIGWALAGLAGGLLPYGAFLLFVRASYALGEGRAPAAAALWSAALGAAGMALAGVLLSGEARLAGMGAAHSLSYLVGACWLGTRLSRRTGERLRPATLGRNLVLSGVLGALGMVAVAALDLTGR